jgi:hypothetical protein
MSSTKYADEGTIAHQLAAMCLAEGTDASAYIGRLLEAEDYEHAKLSPSGAKRWMTCPGSQALLYVDKAEFTPRFYSMEVTDDMAEYVQVYVDMVRARVEQRKLEGAVSVELLVEQPLPIDHMTGEEDATGTGDVVIVSVWEDDTAMLDLIDAKFGRGVEVEVEENPQLLMYGSGALRNLDLLYNFTRACLTVHQPRIKFEPSDWEIDISEIREFEAEALKSAKQVHHVMKFYDNWKNGPDYSYLTPGEHCRTTFCDARATCPKLAQKVEEDVGAEFEDLDEIKHIVEEAVPSADAAILGTKMAAVDLIEDWCKAVRAEVERRLLAGTPVPGYKLVKGRKGSRQWGSESAVEALMKSMRLKREDMYDFKLISPTSAEKLAPKYDKDGNLKLGQEATVIGHKQWLKLKEEIRQADGSPSVAPESDKRPALVITPVADDFDVVDEGEDLAG